MTYELTAHPFRMGTDKEAAFKLLEETIAHHRWCADNCEGDVREEHLQMVRWLEELVLLRAENDKLRELADAVKEFVEDTHCEDCPCRRDCDDNNRIFCVNDFSYHAFAAMRELGIEVDE